MKAAAAVLAASLLFFLGVLTGVGRREAVPPPAAIPLGALNTSPSGTAGSSGEAPADGPKRATTTTAANASPATTPTTAEGPAGTPGATATTRPASGSTAPTASSTTGTTARSGVEQVDGQVDCRPGRGQGNGKREPCPSTTTSTGEAPGGRGTR